MEIDINSIRGKSPDGGTNGPRQKTQTVLLVEGIVRSCRAVSKYETACTMLLEILPVVSSDPAAMDVFLRGKEEIRQFFDDIALTFHFSLFTFHFRPQVRTKTCLAQ